MACRPRETRRQQALRAAKAVAAIKPLPAAGGVGGGAAGGGRAEACYNPAVKTRYENAKALGLTPRSLVLGLLLTGLTDLWIHYAELIMSGVQGHSAIAATATPVGAVTRSIWPFCR